MPDLRDRAEIGARIPLTAGEKGVESNAFWVGRHGVLRAHDRFGWRQGPLETLDGRLAGVRLKCERQAALRSERCSQKS